MIRAFNVCGPADIVPVTGGDCVVGPGDLAELNSQSTSAQNQTCVNIGCPPYCSADFDQSCSVGPEDLADLLAAWRPCDGFEQFNPLRSVACCPSRPWLPCHAAAFVPWLDGATYHRSP